MFAAEPQPISYQPSVVVVVTAVGVSVADVGVVAFVVVGVAVVGVVAVVAVVVVGVAVVGVVAVVARLNSKMDRSSRASNKICSISS